MIARARGPGGYAGLGAGFAVRAGGHQNLVADDEDRIGLNRAWWDERVTIHMAGEFYDVSGFLAGRSTLRPFETAEMGGVAGQRLVHLQCHFGLDTLSWAREGAVVTGVDFVILQARFHYK